MSVVDVAISDGPLPAQRRWWTQRPPIVIGLCATIVLASSALSLVLRSLVPLNVGGSVYDDGLYIRLARSIEQGDWLGPFDKTTLAKNPAYPAFVAFTHQIGLPLKLGEQLTYLLAAAALAGCVLVITHRPVLATAAYVLLAFRPDNFADIDASVLRDGWNASLGLLFLALTFLATTAALARVHLLVVVGATVSAGFVGGIYLLCREEGVSLLPAAGLIVVGVPILAWLRDRRSRPDQPGPNDDEEAAWLVRVPPVVLRYGLALALLGLAMLIPFRYVEHENHAHYGVSLTNDQTTGSFARAFADWSRVRSGPTRPQRPVSRAQREAVYGISPAAAELRDALDVEANPWLRGHCSVAQMERASCDFSGGVIVWAMRDAADAAGHYSTARDFQAYFARIDNDIERACDSGRLRCSTRLPASLQPLTELPAGPFLHALQLRLDHVLSAHEFTDIGERLVPRPEDFAAARVAVAGTPSTPSRLQDQLDRLRADRGVYDTLIGLYRILLPASLILALAGYALAATRPRGRSRAVLVVGAALACGVVLRLLTLAVVESVEFPVNGDRYQLLTRLLLFAFGLVGSLYFVEWVIATVGRPPRGRSGQGDLSHGSRMS